MQDKLQGIENTPAATERRACPRLRPTSLMYMDIGNINGGIVTSLSEGGLAFTAAAILGNTEFGHGPLRIRVQFPGVPEALEAAGEVVWTSSSGKEACLRFVELEDNAREQIRSWISAQTSINELRLEPPTLPKMRLPSSRGAKARRLRFSFADVASSPVASEGETGTEIEQLPEMAREPGELPPLQAKGLTFADGAEVVASAFESPAFAEDQAVKKHSPGNEQTIQAAPEKKPQGQPSLSTPERRQHSRRQILLFTYAVLGEDNGGLVFNLSEGGLALTAAAPLQEDHFKKIHVRFPDSEDWIETSGRLAWKSDSGKEVGIEFAGVPEDARLRIKEWVLQEESAGGVRSEEDGARKSQSPFQELPSFMELDGSSADPSEPPASFEEQPFENQAFQEQRFENGASASAASSSALFDTGIKGLLERASVRRRVAKIKPPQLPSPSERPRSGVARKALSIAAGVALAVGGWMFFQRTSSNEAGGIIAQTEPNPQSLREAAQKPDIVKTGVDATGPATDPPVHSNENNAPQRIAKPSVQQIDGGSAPPNTSKTGPIPSANPKSASKEKPRSERAVADVPPANFARRSDQSQGVLPARSEQETKAQPPTASAPTPEIKLVENKPVETKSAETKAPEGKSVQIAQALPTLNSNKDANATPPALNSNPPQPAATAAVVLEKEKLSVAPKPPEPPVARTPVVSVSFDPYPSILMPKTEKSKKSHQGKSLQMGRLLSRVDPIYPEEARQQSIEGTVRLHTIFNREGVVQSVTSMSGPPMLVPAAMNAVRQWRYSQTILGGQAMETEEDVTVQFRLASSASKN